MKLTIRIWILGIVLGLSIIAILSGSSSEKGMLFVLFIAIMAVLSMVKSTSGRVFIILILLIAAGFLVYSSMESGVVVKSVDRNSPIFEEGLRMGEIITSVNGQAVVDKASYSAAIDGLFNGNETKKLDIKTTKNEYIVLTNETPKITVDEVPTTSIQTGLDLRGGARALVRPDVEITDAQLNDLIDVSRNRFNVYGLSDIKLSGVTDLDGNKFMLVEVAGATPSDLEELVSKQGKFEARIGNWSASRSGAVITGSNSSTINATETNESAEGSSSEEKGILVFEGGKGDISDVCRNRAECAGIMTPVKAETGYVASFRFTVYLTEAAAKKHAEVTKNISLDSSGKYLTEKIYLYVDGKEVDSLLIGADLRGQVTTQISIQGSGTGNTVEDAVNDAKINMNKLQTILITGSLPYKLNIEKLDTISPVLGGDFTYYILIAGAASMIAVGLLIFLRYRNVKASAALLFTSFSEIVIILGIAALIKWNLDLPSIAGILATIGTGVDQQIVILDEASSKVQISLKEKLKRALFVVVGAYFTAMVSLLPLYWAVAGLFKGFAITTLIGITVGVLLTRPAFSDMISKIEE